MLAPCSALTPDPRCAARRAAGLELGDAVAAAVTARDALRALAAADAPNAAARAAAAALLPPLALALPVVGAAAADFARPSSPFDLSIAAFAFLDRGVDGASLGCGHSAWRRKTERISASLARLHIALRARSGGNQSISPADIERLEALEAATQDALDAAAALAALLAAGGDADGAAVARAARLAAARVDALLEELPRGVLAAAMRKR